MGGGYTEELVNMVNRCEFPELVRGVERGFAWANNKRKDADLETNTSQ